MCIVHNTQGLYNQPTASFNEYDGFIGIEQRGSSSLFFPKKGYGFIEPEDGTKDIFVHVSALQNSGISNLLEEQQVTYDVAKEKGKTSAVNISISE